jgi:hypothetical protein
MFQILNIDRTVVIVIVIVIYLSSSWSSKTGYKPLDMERVSETNVN